MTVLETPQSEDAAPTLQRVFHKEPGTHADDAVTFDYAGKRYELVVSEDAFTIAHYTPGAEHDTIEQIVLPRDVAPIFVHPEVQELLCK